jgi:hypothetical protein
MIPARLIPLLLATTIISACQPAPSIQPVAIEYGVDVCGACDDVIKDRRFAAEYVIAGNVVKKFDDPGCLFRALRNEPDAPNAAFFQHIDKDQWINDKDAWLATTPKIMSPKGFNWAAYGSFGEAQTAVATAGGGQILPYAQGKERIARVAPTPLPTAVPTEPSDS